MDWEWMAGRGVVLLGCGKMGAALLEGWLARGLPSEAAFVRDPAPSDWLRSQGVRFDDPPAAPALVLVAVKPQVLDEALPDVARWGGGDTLFVSIAAGVTLDRLAGHLDPATPIVRAMPNTPAAIGQGITALAANDAAGDRGLAAAEALLGAGGETLRLCDEASMDAVTAVSGSGPAYVFHLIEAMADAGEAEGLPREMAERLATATVAGAGRLAAQSGEAAGTLRENVTSPGGTTEAALDVLMDKRDGLRPLVARAVRAAAARSRELAQ